MEVISLRLPCEYSHQSEEQNAALQHTKSFERHVAYSFLKVHLSFGYQENISTCSRSADYEITINFHARLFDDFAKFVRSKL